MPRLDIFWNDQIERHIAAHHLSYQDVANAVADPLGEAISGSSGRPIFFGYAVDGRKIAVVYEMIDSITLYPVTAYEVK